MTTFNRPTALARSLPQIAALGYPTVVVDDGSSGAARTNTRRIAADCGVDLIVLPSNRGLASALNVGLGYLLADAQIEWISYFQDDVDVDPHVIDRLRLLEDATTRPVLTGYDRDSHAAQTSAEILGVPVKLKQFSAGVHLHAHPAYWKSVLPIPTSFLGAPKRKWGPSFEDDWITREAPMSAGRRGLPIVGIPDLVRTFLWHAADSTWDGEYQLAPPLKPI